ncbi:MAG TPA: YaiO family outer membrane beta-barrel protein [Paludibacter sp.]
MRHILLLFFLSASLTGAIAQINTDSIFNTAINLAKNQNYALAIENAKEALKQDSKRGDIMVFIANVYSWQNKNDTALIYIQEAQKVDYRQNDFYEAKTNILLRSGKYGELLTNCNEALENNYSNTEDILKKKMIAYDALKEYNNGINLIELPENKKYLESKSIDDLYSTLLLKRNTNVISAYYTLDMFDSGFTPQHLAALGYSFKIGEHNLGFRLNYANRFGLNDVQLESDFYLKLKQKQYMYFNYGYAFNASLFPTHRFGLEYYFPLPNKFEASIGGRYLNYTNSDVFIVTGHLGKYIAKSWMGIRPFYVYKTPANTQSLSLIANYRIFSKTELDYWGVEVGLGNSPDDIYSTSQIGGFNQLKAYKIKLEKNFMLNRTSDLHIGLGYSREEYGTITTQFRNRFTVELGYKIRFK